MAVKGDSRDSQQWDPLMVCFPYKLPISLGILDGEWCGKLVWVRGPMSLGVPENPTDFEPVLL